MSIAAVEAFLIQHIKTLLGSHVKGVESLPGDWDDEMLSRFAKSVPGVYVSFTGGEPQQQGSMEAAVNGTFAVYVATGHPNEQARRLGDAMQIGTYQLLQLLVPHLHGLVVPDVGSVSMGPISNLFTGTIERKALAVYALVLRVPITFELVPAAAALAPFETFAAAYDTPPHTPELHPAWLAGNDTTPPDARDTVALPQP